MSSDLVCVSESMKVYLWVLVVFRILGSERYFYIILTALPPRTEHDLLLWWAGCVRTVRWTGHPHRCACAQPWRVHWGGPAIGGFTPESQVPGCRGDSQKWFPLQRDPVSLSCRIRRMCAGPRRTHSGERVGSGRHSATGARPCSACVRVLAMFATIRALVHLFPSCCTPHARESVRPPAATRSPALSWACVQARAGTLDCSGECWRFSC